MTVEPEKQKRLTKAEWLMIESYWELGTHSLTQLSEEFGIRADTIQRTLKERGIVKGSRAHETAAKVSDEILDETAQRAAETVRRSLETKDVHYRYAEAIAKMVMQELIDAKQARQAVSMKDGNLAALNKAAKTLEVLRKERFSILGLDKDNDDDPDDLGELLVSEMTEDQIIAMQVRMRASSTTSDLDDLEGLGEIGSDIVEEFEE